MNLINLNNELLFAADEKAYLQLDLKVLKAKPKEKLTTIYQQIEKQIKCMPASNQSIKDTLKERVQTLQDKYHAKCNTILSLFLTSSFVAFFCPSYRKSWKETCASYNSLQTAITNLQVEDVDPPRALKMKKDEGNSHKSSDQLLKVRVVFMKIFNKDPFIPMSIFNKLGEEGKKHIHIVLSDLFGFLGQYQKKFDAEIIEVEVGKSIAEDEWKALAGFSKIESIKEIRVNFKELEIQSIIDSEKTRAVFSKLKVVGEPEKVKISDQNLTEDDLFAFLSAMPTVKNWETVL